VTGAPLHTLGGPRGGEAERRLIRALRDGDESTFAELVDRYAPAMLRVAAAYVPSREIAEDVVQDAWLALLKGLDRFQARARLQTWLFRILINIAKTRGARERRCIPFSALAAARDDHPLLDPARFLSADHPEMPGHWARPPRDWPHSPEQRALSTEAQGRLRSELDRLPQRQRVVVALRDVAGLTAAEVCAALDITAENQRVLLHRGRTRLRGLLEDYDPHDGV
jgi:RNA polymerase sigma-70 factor (ECF subfamily)